MWDDFDRRALFAKGDKAIDEDSGAQITPLLPLKTIFHGDLADPA